MAERGHKRDEPHPWVREQGRDTFMYWLHKLAPKVFEELAALEPLYAEAAGRKKLEGQRKRVTSRGPGRATPRGPRETTGGRVDSLEGLEHRATESDPAQKLLDGLRAWSSRWLIAEPWIEDRALGVLAAWADDPDALKARQLRLQSRAKSPRLRQGVMLHAYADDAGEPLETRSGLLKVSHSEPEAWNPRPPADLVLEIPGFRPDEETEGQASARLRRAFEAALVDHLEANRESYASVAPRAHVQRVPGNIDRNAQWTVQVHVLGVRYGDLTTLRKGQQVATNESDRARRQAVREFASLIGLEKRRFPGGRPRK